MVLSKLTLWLGTFFVVLTVALCGAAATAGHHLPESDQITYVSRQDGFSWNLYHMDVGRGLTYNLTGRFMNWPVRNQLPQWSPDGKQLAFVSSANHSMSIMVLDYDTDRMRFLTENSTGFRGHRQDQTAPAWSNGVPRIAYAAYNGYDWDIYLHRLDRSNIVLAQGLGTSPYIIGDENDRKPAWSPDGSKLAFISGPLGQSDVWLADTQRHTSYPLTQGINVADHALAWSPTGTHIAFVTEHDFNQEIYIVNVESGGMTNLTRNSTDDFAPAWSPDGTQIVFVSDRDGDDELYLMDRFGGSVQQLTDNLFPDDSPQWHLDGKRLLYTATRYVVSEIYLMDVESGHIRQLTHNNVEDWSPVWRP